MLAWLVGADRSSALKHEKLRCDFENLSRKIGDLESQLERLLESNRQSTDYCEELEAQLAFLRQPNDLRSAQQLIAILLRHQIPLPDDIHEQALRLALREKPFDNQLTYSLVALLMRQQRAPFPDQSESLGAEEPNIEGPPVDVLVDTANQRANEGDTVGVYASLWQAVVRFPKNARGWAEYARAFVDRGEFDFANTAVQRGLSISPVPDPDSFVALSHAFARLAEDGIPLSESYAHIVDHSNDPSAAVQIARSQLFRLAGETEESVTAATNAILRKPKSAESHLAAFLAHFSSGDFERSYYSLVSALQLSPVFVIHEITRSYGAQAFTVCVQLDKAKEVADWLTDAYDRTPQVTLVPSWPAPEYEAQARRLRENALACELPSALLVTQPKSASVSIGGILGKGFSLPTVLCYFLQTHVISPWASDFKRGGGLSTGHLQPLANNIDLLLKSGISRVLVNVRDPRGQLLSAIHHASRYSAFNHPDFNARWLTYSFDEKFDYIFREYFPNQLEWINGWLAAREKLDIRFSTYRDFIENRDDFVEKMVADYGGNPRYFNRSAALEMTPGIDYHIRKGTTDSWKLELSKTQIKQINDAVPSDWWHLFSWNP